jgi:hypothetical protein
MCDQRCVKKFQGNLKLKFEKSKMLRKQNSLSISAKARKRFNILESDLRVSKKTLKTFKMFHRVFQGLKIGNATLV